MKNFTFGVITYNHEKYIIETMESIKYQILLYGRNIDVSLIINDDASSDYTVSFLNKWLEDNNGLFQSTICNYNSNNKGTVTAINYIVNKCNTSFYRIIAGDDVLSSNNVFDCCESLDSNELKTYIRMDLCEGIIRMNYPQLKKFYVNSKKKNYLKAMREGCYLHTPSTIYKRDLYITSKCEEFNKNFRLYEDDPTWYSIIKNNPDIKITFCEDFVCLYRISEQSISNTHSGTLKIQEEFNNLWRYYSNDSSGLEKKYFESKLKNTKFKYFSFYKYVDKFRVILMEIKCYFSGEYRKIENKVKAKMKDEQLYYDAIKTKAESFAEEYFIDASN